MTNPSPKREIPNHYAGRRSATPRVRWPTNCSARTPPETKGSGKAEAHTQEGVRFRTTGPQRLHLSDLKRAFAERERLQRTEQRRFPMHQGQGPKEF